MAINTFIIVRNDLDTDPVALESAGLTIGRLTGNDLVLNHPTVSRTHAGIKEVGADFWVFNLSKANGTLLNGELVDSTPLADGDAIQIGPFFLRPTYTDDLLMLEVEMSVKPMPLAAARTGALQPPGEAGATLMLDRGSLVQAEWSSRRRGTGRTSGTGVTSGIATGPDERALRAFWDQRKREAGKLGAESPFRPKDRRRLGKARFYWRPTHDLQRSWPVAVFIWISLIVTALSVAAAFTFSEAYAPGALSVAHARSSFSFTPVIAVEPNSASCSTCHSSKASMEENCASCHTTRVFDPSISDRHRAAGLSCRDCHGEHKGRAFQPAMVANTRCASCHQDGVVFEGTQLRTPHGGTLGYPISNGEWHWAGLSQAEWRLKGLPRSRLRYSLIEQFHLVHVAGKRQGRANCSDCHTAGLEGDAVHQGVRESCANCHTLNYQVAGTLEAGTGCVACHSQHGIEREARASRRTMELVK